MEKLKKDVYKRQIEKVKLKQSYDIAVIDEIQMISDTQRGIAWSLSLIHIYLIVITVYEAKYCNDLKYLYKINSKKEVVASIC